MASPIKTAKQAVDLAAPVVRVSRIRRDPPPPVKTVTAAEIRERDARGMAIGISALTLAALVLLLAATNAAGWSPSQYTITIREQG
jgi:hypothetical protein